MRKVFKSSEYAELFGVRQETIASFMRTNHVAGYKIGSLWYWNVDSFWEAYDAQIWDDRHPPLREKINDGWALTPEVIAKVEECLKKPQ